MGAAEVVGLGRAVGMPADRLVEAAAGGVVLEDPEHQLGDVGRSPEAIHRRHECRADAAAPPGRIDVDGVDLTVACGVEVVVAGRSGVGEAEDRIGLVDSDEGGRIGPGGRPDARAPLRGALAIVEAGEERARQDPGVRGAPAGDLDATDGVGVIGPGEADLDYGWASQVSPGSSSTTVADVCSRSSAGVPTRIGNVA